jgi:hypothetical protein
MSRLGPVTASFRRRFGRTFAAGSSEDHENMLETVNFMNFARRSAPARRGRSLAAPQHVP